MRRWPQPLGAMLFDLDGTLLDSAPDLYTALQRMCEEKHASVPPYEQVRAVVSRGARAVLRCAFSAQGESAIEAMAPRFLDIYQQVMGQQTKPFPGIEALLAGLETRDIAWGIVTNKAGWLAEELVRRIGWNNRFAALVAGDTLAVAKPDPAPVRLACERAGVTPAQGVYVGDDARDVAAGNGAGLFTVAVSWGYLNGENPHRWGADLVLESPEQLTDRLRTIAPLP